MDIICQFKYKKIGGQRKKMILTKVWERDLEILEICGQVSQEENTQQKLLKQTEIQNSKNKHHHFNRFTKRKINKLEVIKSLLTRK